MTGGPPAATDAVRLQALRRSKALAAGLLLAAAVVYAATFLPHDGGSGGWGFVRAATEAALVGGMADWFAVTALFRRPLGLPIPHTALIPSRKDALGRSLEQFVGSNFLTEAVVRERIAAERLPERVGEWLSDPGHVRRLAAELADAAAGIVRRMDADASRRVADLLLTVAEQRLPLDQAAPVLGRLLAAVVDDGGHRVPLARLAGRLSAWIGRDNALKDVLVGIGISRDRFLGNRLINVIEAVLRERLHELATSPGEQAWVQIDGLARGLAESMQHDPVTVAAVADVVHTILGSPELRRSAGGATGFARTLLAELLEEHDGELRAGLASLASQAGDRLLADAGLRASLSERVAGAVATVVTTYRDQLTAVITATIARWDGAETARRVELLAGRDLQFIRLNGTVVGALVGVAIHALSTAS